MKDEKGLYYHPSLQEPAVRMYVRRVGQSIEFRMHNPDYPEIWERHQWVPFEAIKQAAQLYKEQSDTGRNPLALYDMAVAKRLLADDEA